MLVYICEAHASDVWPLKFSFEQPRPTSLVQRAQYAMAASDELGFEAAGFRLLCDGMDDAFNVAFGAWPAAYFLVNAHGALLHVGEADNDLAESYNVRHFINVVRGSACEPAETRQ